MSEHEDKHTNDFHELSGKEGMQKISELVKGIHIAMMSTLAAGGQIHSRPMGTQDVPFNGTF
jgi:general stress protein 26